jgi:hypothetical protein
MVRLDIVMVRLDRTIGKATLVKASVGESDDPDQTMTCMGVGPDQTIAPRTLNVPVPHRPPGG